jgi:hypothetical protein
MASLFGSEPTLQVGRAGRTLGGALALQQHRMGEALNLGRIHSGRLGDFLNRGARPDAGLNIFRT